MNNTQSKPIADYAITKPAQSTNIFTEWQIGALLLTMQRRIAGLVATLAEPYLAEPIIEALQKLNEARIEEFIPTRADADLWEHWQSATAAGLDGESWNSFTAEEMQRAATAVISKYQIPQPRAAQMLLVAAGYTPDDVRTLLKK